jgi:hypothetical protein
VSPLELPEGLAYEPEFLSEEEEAELVAELEGGRESRERRSHSSSSLAPPTCSGPRALGVGAQHLAHEGSALLAHLSYFETTLVLPPKRGGHAGEAALTVRGACAAELQHAGLSLPLP